MRVFAPRGGCMSMGQMNCFSHFANVACRCPFGPNRVRVDFGAIAQREASLSVVQMLDLCQK